MEKLREQYEKEVIPALMKKFGDIKKIKIKKLVFVKNAEQN